MQTERKEISKEEVKRLGQLMCMARSTKCPSNRADRNGGPCRDYLDNPRVAHLTNISLFAKVHARTTRVLINATVKRGMRHNDEEVEINFHQILDNESEWYSQVMELI